MGALNAEQLAEEFRTTDPRELRTDCPPSAQVWAAVAGELEPDGVHRLVAHTARCVDCSVAWRVALEVNRDGESQAPALPFRPRRPHLLLLPGALGLLAAGVAAAVLVQGVSRQPKALKSVVVEANSERGAKRPLGSLTAAGAQSKGAVVLRWSPYPPAQRYSVTVMSSSLQVLYQAFGLTSPELRIPPEALAAQPSGARLLWTVQAILADGRGVDSDVFTLDVN
ncbi:MAG: hypothetical protein ACLQDQ_14555 [Myxococcaceae bacterium]